MSGYEWPTDRARKRDRKEQRADYNAEVFGRTDTDLIEEICLEGLRPMRLPKP